MNRNKYPFRSFIVRPTRATFRRSGVTVEVVPEMKAEQWTVYGVIHLTPQPGIEEEAIANCPNFDFAERIREALTSIHNTPNMAPFDSSREVGQ